MTMPPPRALHTRLWPQRIRETKSDRLLGGRRSFRCFHRGQGKEKSGTALRLSLCPDAAAVAGDNTLHAGEADAGAGIVGLGVQPLKRLEYFVDVGHVEARAVVAGEAGDLRGRRGFDTEFDNGALGARRGLPPVAQ